MRSLGVSIPTANTCVIFLIAILQEFLANGVVVAIDKMPTTSGEIRSCFASRVGSEVVIVPV